MTRPRKRALSMLLALALPFAACGGDEAPVDVSGVYNLNLTNGQNECMVQQWMMGQSSVGAATLTVTQDAVDRTRASARVGGLGALFVSLVYMSDTFNGTVAGSTVDMQLARDREVTEGGCVFRPIARLSASLGGDTLAGSIKYSYTTNGHADCGYRSTCVNVQNFNGSRPPRQ